MNCTLKSHTIIIATILSYTAISTLSFRTS